MPDITNPKKFRNQTKHPLYETWNAIKGRCENPNTSNYINYGGRGIEMCKKWRDDFPTFVSDMGPKPSQHHSIERIDNDKSYCPENCMWQDRYTQSRNKRNNVVITYQGQTMILKDWAKFFGISYSCISDRYRRGKTTEEIFFVGKLVAAGWLDDGIWKSVGELSKMHNINRKALRNRYLMGWSLERSISEPLRNQKKRKRHAINKK
jgi:hypothetical protein